MTKPTIFDGMLNEVCEKMGFCGSVVDGEARHVTDFIPKTGTVSAEQFASWVLIAEGMSPELERAFRQDLKSVFVEHMKADVVDTEHLHRLINE